jgi:hypothetical protein
MSKLSKEFLEEYYSKGRQDFIDNNFIELQKIFVNIKEIRKRYINQRHPLSLLCLEISLMLSFKYDEKTESIVEGIIGENLN